MITIVSGLPRSGTSLMMQMLAAGGMTLLSDFERKPDDDNPRGYCEWEPAKLLAEKPDLIEAAEGKAVKVISQFLQFLPEGHNYEILFMERPLLEVLASQAEMLRRRGSSAPVKDDVIAAAFTKHLREVQAWLGTRKNIAVLLVPYRQVLGDPLTTARTVRDFLERQLNCEAMAGEVDAALYRNRRG